MGRFVLKSSLEKLILVFGILFTFIFSISAETVLLQEGGSYRGKVITQNQKTLTIQTKHGKHVISKKEILKVIYKDVSEEGKKKFAMLKSKDWKKKNLQNKEVWN